MKKKDLKELNEMLNKMIDILGCREAIDEMKKEYKPQFKILIETNENPNAKGDYTIEVEGTGRDLMIALAELAGRLVEKSILDKEAILEAVKQGLENADDEEE